MKLPRRQFLHLAAGATALAVAPRIAFAQAYPTRPVRIIVGFAPGGAYDIAARLMSQFSSERLGQPFILHFLERSRGGVSFDPSFAPGPPEFSVDGAQRARP